MSKVQLFQPQIVFSKKLKPSKYGLSRRKVDEVKVENYFWFQSLQKHEKNDVWIKEILALKKENFVLKIHEFVVQNASRQFAGTNSNQSRPQSAIPGSSLGQPQSAIPGSRQPQSVIPGSSRQRQSVIPFFNTPLHPTGMALPRIDNKYLQTLLYYLLYIKKPATTASEEVKQQRKDVYKEIWTDASTDRDLQFTKETYLAFLEAFASVGDKAMVEKIHDIMQKKRAVSEWCPMVYQSLMDSHVKSCNWRAVKRLGEEYVLHFKSMDNVQMVQNYLTALSMAGNHEYLVYFASSHLCKKDQQYTKTHLNKQCFKLILDSCVERKDAESVMKWFNIIDNYVKRHISSVDDIYTCFYPVIDALTTLKNERGARKVYERLKVFRTQVVEFNNKKEGFEDMTVARMVDLFEKAIQGGKYPLSVVDTSSHTKVVQDLNELESQQLKNYRTWTSPMTPIQPTSQIMYLLALSKNQDAILDFFNSNVLGLENEFLDLYWARQVSSTKKRIIDILETSKSELAALQGQFSSSATTVGGMPTKTWRRVVPNDIRSMQSSSKEQIELLKKNIGWCNKKLKKNLRVSIITGERGPLQHVYDALIRGWRQSTEDDQEDNVLGLERVVEKLQSVELERLESVRVAPFLNFRETISEEQEDFEYSMDTIDPKDQLD